MIKVHPNAVVDKSAELSDGVNIGPNCVVAGGVSIGPDTVLGPNVVIGKNVKIGRNNQFFANSVIGGKPQMLNLSSDDELGRLCIGDDNSFYEQVTIHPSIYKDKFTEVGNSNLLMIGAHIGHDCIVEDKIVMSNYVQLSGHCKIETGVWLSAMVMLHQFVTIGKWCYAAGLAGINHDIPPFLTVSGHYPPKIRGVNKRGLGRAGLDQQQQQKIFDAYKKLYRRKGTLLENADSLAQEDGLDENVQAMIESITRSNQHRFGRYLEQFRH